ncbi:MAG TPA: metallopeptidase family protein [Candidatus Saccharimonadales bacterium]|jgi:predicted Zn-dependent protease with MMP-like domain|nr:metallopeptidase family protein [Candidatus Saccharimonadales bacterium]
MIEVNDEEFQQLINQALEELPGEHVKAIKNVAILYEDVPTPEQRQQLALRNDQTLLGLYEGTPLPQRQGIARLLPDKITLFKIPLQYHSSNLVELKEQIKHTLWHEIAHYYGLDHQKIHELE